MNGQNTQSVLSIAYWGKSSLLKFL